VLLTIVTDEELWISEIVKIILLVLLTSGVVYNLISLIKGGRKIRMVINSILILIFLTTSFFVIREFFYEGVLLSNYQYVPGTTLDYCDVTTLGKGISFNYELRGKQYHSCNTFYPVSVDSIKVPGGRFKVRVSQKYPARGRMDFHKPMK